jgi:transposase
LRSAPVGRAGEAECDASGELGRALVTVLGPLVAQSQPLSAAIAAALADPPDGPLGQSRPRSGQGTAAPLLAELGDDRGRFPTAEQLAAEAGTAPVTRASGKHRAVVFRWACHRSLRQAVTTFADNSRPASLWAAGVYARARARGCDHPHAIRIPTRAWLRVIWRCWQDRRPLRAHVQPGRKGAADGRDAEAERVPARW